MRDAGRPASARDPVPHVVNGHHPAACTTAGGQFAGLDGAADRAVAHLQFAGEGGDGVDRTGRGDQRRELRACIFVFTKIMKEVVKTAHAAAPQVVVRPQRTQRMSPSFGAGSGSRHPHQASGSVTGVTGVPSGGG